MTVREVLEECGFAVRDDHKIIPSSTRRLIALYEELIERQQAEISRLRLLLEARDGY